MNTDVIARLAAANPVPGPQPAARRTRRRYALVLAAAALLVPAAYAADRLLGISNEGTSVPTSSVLPGQSQLDQALQELQVGETMQSLGVVNGVATVAFVGADGSVLDSTPVTDNLFASSTRIGLGVAAYVEGLAADGSVVAKQTLPG